MPPILMMIMIKMMRVVLKLTMISLLLTQSCVRVSTHDSETSQGLQKNLSVCSQTTDADGALIVNCSSSGLDKLADVHIHIPHHDKVVLDISNSHIQELGSLPDEGMFSQVIKVILKMNEIKTVTADIFKRMKALKSLNLCANILTKWNFPADLEDLANFEHDLELLDLSYNKISMLTDVSFSFTNFLSKLNISYNVLTKIEERTFEKLKYLKVLDLSRNKLTTLPGKLFSKLTSLSHLYLSNNELLTVPSAVPILDLLDLSFNKITSVEETQNHVIYPHEIILLGGNPFRCDCKLLWLKEFYDTREYLLKFVDLDKNKFIPVCETPESLNGDTWDVIGDDVFDCDKDAQNHEIGQTALTEDDDDHELLLEKEETEVKEFEVLDITARSARLNWLVNSGDFVVITYRAFGDKDRHQAAVLPATTTSFVLRHLKANKPYVVCISSTETLNDDGSARNEKCIEIMTAEEAKEINKFILLLSLIAETLFNHRFLTALIFTCILVVTRIVYMLISTNRKQKQS